jgi:energy-coupling factor transport system permease protein
VNSINPAVKFISLVVMTLVLAFFHDPLVNFIIFAVCAALIIVPGGKTKVFLGSMVPIVILAAGMFFTGYRFSADAGMPVKSDTMLFADSQLINGLILSSRVMVYAGIGFLFAFTTDRIEMIKSFEKQLHLPQLFAYGILAAWGMFPQMIFEYKRTIAAFRARGIKVFPVSPRVLKPLLVKSVRWSEELSVAMESKGFSGRDARTVHREIKIRKRDLLMLGFCCAVFPAIMVVISRL